MRELPILSAAGHEDAPLEAAFQVLDRAYEAGPDARAWQEVMGLLAGLLDAPRVLLVEEETEVFRILAASAAVGVSDPPRRLRPEIVRAAGDVSFVVTRLGGPLCLLVERASLPGAASRLLGRLAPHLARAWRETEWTPVHPLQSLAGEALERLAFAVILATADGTVRITNAAARELLSRRDGISIVGGRLRASSTPVQAHLARALQRVAMHPHGSGMAMRVPRAGHLDPLELLVAPLGGDKAGAESSGPAPTCCAVFVSDPQSPPETPAEVMRGLYGLTRAESRIAAELLRGRSADGIAARLAVSVHTVRTHVKRIFEKVGTSRQSDLVRLLLSGPGRVRWG